MPKLRDVKASEVVNALYRLGFEPVRQVGSHLALRKQLPDGRVVGCTVPMHPILARGTLQSILRQAELSHDEFLVALGKQRRWRLRRD